MHNGKDHKESKMSLSSIFGRGKAGQANSTGEEKKPLFLEAESLKLYPMVAGKLLALSKLPNRTDIHEWLATNTLAFFNHVNIQVGAITEMCTSASCPTMTAGRETFEWLEDRPPKKRTKAPAKQFIDTSLSQIQQQLQDEEIFPTKFGFDFPPEFVQLVRRMFRTYFAILAHIYYHHFREIRRLGLHDGLNTLFLHLVYFVREFLLMEQKEMTCLEELIDKLTQLDRDLAQNPTNEDFSVAFSANAHS